MTTTDHPPHRARPIHAPVTALSHAAGSDHRPLLVNAVVHFQLAPGTALRRPICPRARTRDRDARAIQ